MAVEHPVQLQICGTCEYWEPQGDNVGKCRIINAPGFSTGHPTLASIDVAQGHIASLITNARFACVLWKED